jgi:3-dehydroquinate synthase
VTAIRVHLPGVAGSAPGTAAADDRSYDIHVGPGLLAEVGPLLRAAAATRAVVISDAAVAGSHAAAVVRSLEAVGVSVTTCIVPSGEGSKSIAGASRLWDEFARLAVDRGTQVVAVGGGVVGDLAGFVAATFARGLAVWHVPTTVVAQVDSAIGGKTGINLAGGKNLVGAFWQPRGVIADIDALASLPDREFTSGLAEVVKYGMILDAEFLSWLETHAAALRGRKPGELTHAIERSAALKAGVVSADEREVTGLRVILNYGHTFAHALETGAGYGTLLHGEAVAIGMTAAARLAARLGRIGREIVERQDRLLDALGLPRTAPAAGSVEDLLAVMARDKKSVAGRLRFVLPSRIGHVELVDGVDEAAVRDVLQGLTPTKPVAS